MQVPIDAENAEFYCDFESDNCTMTSVSWPGVTESWMRVAAGVTSIPADNTLNLGEFADLKWHSV